MRPHDLARRWIDPARLSWYLVLASLFRSEKHIHVFEFCGVRAHPVRFVLVSAPLQLSGVLRRRRHGTLVDLATEPSHEQDQCAYLGSIVVPKLRLRTLG